MKRPVMRTAWIFAALVFGCGPDNSETLAVELGCDSDCNGPNCAWKGPRLINEECIPERVDHVCVEFEHPFPDVVIETAIITRAYNTQTGEVRMFNVWQPNNEPLCWEYCEASKDVPDACTCRY